MAGSESASISILRPGAPSGDPDRTVVWLSGAHDIATKVALSVALARASKLDRSDVVVDLRLVTFMDASAMDALVTARNRLREQSRTLELRGPSPAARRVIELCGCGHFIEVDVRHPTGGGAALGTWVEVGPSEVSDAESLVMTPEAVRDGDRRGA